MKTEVYKKFLLKELKNFFRFKPSVRSWHIPLLAGLSVGIPLLTGYFLNDIRSALTASLAGLVILYLPNDNDIFDVMAKMFICAFGMVISYSVGLVFSFNFWVASFAFGVLSLIVFYIARSFEMKPPGSFFFIMICSMAIGLPHDLNKIPLRVGVFTLGSINACLLTFFYVVIFQRKKSISHKTKRLNITSHSVNFHESLIIGIFMFFSIFIGKVLNLNYPYWIPISSLAVLQGVNQFHVWKRGFHRILGTLIGLIIAWLIFTTVKNPLGICLCIIFLQFIVELLITRHYALAVTFLTPMGILLAETGSPISFDPDHLIKLRFLEILIGSVLGSIGGWFLYNEKIRFGAIKNLKKAKTTIEK